MSFWTCQNVKKRPQAPKPFFWIWNMKNLETGFQIFIFFENYEKDAHEKTMQNGSSTFANELMRFPNEAKPIWVEIQKHCKKCSHKLNGALTF